MRYVLEGHGGFFRRESEGSAGFGQRSDLPNATVFESIEDVFQAMHNRGVYGYREVIAIHEVEEVPQQFKIIRTLR